jgi:KDO2-lipid IV(A) lauroyltransferase
MKNISKKIRYDIAGFLVGIAEFIIPRTPLRLTNSVMYLLFCLTSPTIYLFPDIRKVLFPNIDLAFGTTLTKREKRKMAKKALWNLVKMAPDLLYYFNPRNHHEIVENCTIHGIDHLETALKRGNGVIAVSAHVSNFVIMIARIVLTGLPTNIVMKYPKNEMLTGKFDYYLGTLGIRTIDADKKARAVRDILRALRNNEIVIIVADERKKHDGIPVPFFGRDALTAPGPAVLALRSGAALIPTFVHSMEHSSFDVEILPPIKPELTGEKEKDIYNISLSINMMIEEYIRKYPEQWAWTNPRWKGAGRYGIRHERHKINEKKA